jgi:valyl-tRNA synthetase
LNNYQFNSKTVIIGHSLGAVLTLKLGEKVENLAGIALVAGFSQPKFVDNLPFPFADRFSWTFDFQRIKDNCGFINIYTDLNDCYVPVDQGRLLKEKLDGDYFEYVAENTHFMQFRETRVLETVLQSLGKNTIGLNDFETFYPTQTMTTAKEIFYLWIIRMIVLGKYFTSQLPENSSVYNKIPFENVVITPTVLDEKGKKMSKSLGNGLDPVSQIEKYSSDSLRMALLAGMIPNRNMRMGGRLADEQCLKYRNYGNKIWNVARFLESKLDNYDSKDNFDSLNSPSIWILQKFIQLENDLEQNLQIYELAHNVESLYKCLWDNFADWYVEYLKTDDSQVGFAVELFKRFIILLYPYLPFETEVLWKEFILKHSLSEGKDELLAFVQKDPVWSKQILGRNQNESAQEFELSVDFVKDLRSLRGLFAIDPGTEVKVYTKSKEILQFKQFIKLVAKAELAEESPINMYTVNKGEYEYSLDIFAYIKDRDSEIKRTQKLMEKLQKQIDSLERQLANEEFMEKAGEAVVEDKKKNLQERKLELIQQEEKMGFLEK